MLYIVRHFINLMFKNKINSLKHFKITFLITVMLYNIYVYTCFGLSADTACVSLLVILLLWDLVRSDLNHNFQVHNK